MKQQQNIHLASFKNKKDFPGCFHKLYLVQKIPLTRKGYSCFVFTLSFRESFEGLSRSFSYSLKSSFVYRPPVHKKNIFSLLQLKKNNQDSYVSLSSVYEFKGFS